MSCWLTSSVFGMLGQKEKLVLFTEIGQVKFFYHSATCIVECVSEYI